MDLPFLFLLFYFYFSSFLIFCLIWCFCENNAFFFLLFLSSFFFILFSASHLIFAKTHAFNSSVLLFSALLSYFCENFRCSFFPLLTRQKLQNRPLISWLEHHKGIPASASPGRLFAGCSAKQYLCYTSVISFSLRSVTFLNQCDNARKFRFFWRPPSGKCSFLPLV